MSYVKISEAKAAYNRKYAGQRKAPSEILREQAGEFSAAKSYDVFLSHAFKDAELILGVKALLEEQGYVVYVDWIEDKQLNRENVSCETANVLRQRMKACKCFLFAATNASQQSKWMPGELGFFDGFRPGHIAVLPLLADNETTFDGQEYVRLYPRMDIDASGGYLLPIAKPGMRLRSFKEFSNSAA